MMLIDFWGYLLSHNEKGMTLEKKSPGSGCLIITIFWLHNKLPQNSVLKTTVITYYLTVSLGQKL